MLVKLSGPISGHNFDYTAGDIVDLIDVDAKAWIAAGLAVEAPPNDVAVKRIERLERDLADARAAVAGHVSAADKTASDVANAKSAMKQAIVEMKTREARLEEARAANDALAQTLSAREKDLERALGERDDFQAQAVALGEQIERMGIDYAKEIAAIDAKHADNLANAPPAPPPAV
jgi:chromosome segregation ATPase